MRGTMCITFNTPVCIVSCSVVPLRLAVGAMTDCANSMPEFVPHKNLACQRENANGREYCSQG